MMMHFKRGGRTPPQPPQPRQQTQYTADHLRQIFAIIDEQDVADYLDMPPRSLRSMAEGKTPLSPAVQEVVHRVLVFRQYTAADLRRVMSIVKEQNITQWLRMNPGVVKSMAAGERPLSAHVQSFIYCVLVEVPRLRGMLKALGWSQRQFADHIGEDERKARRFLTGELEIPQEVWTAMERAMRDKGQLPPGDPK